MKQEKTRTELLITNLPDVFEPKEHMSPRGERDKWRSVSYECSAFSGTLLTSLCTGKPGNITYSPHLCGWYKIFLVLPHFTRLNVFIKLSSDEAFEKVRTHRGEFEEVLWRCADMTDESIVLTRRYTALSNTTAALAGIRFVPMTENEVETWLWENSRTDTRSLYVGNDIHNLLCSQEMNTPEDWHQVLLPYRGSDVEWFAPEEIRMIMGGKTPVPPAEFAFFRTEDCNAQQQLPKLPYDNILRTLVNKSHEIGIKVAVSLRMGAWGIELPYDQTYFDSPFFLENPQWRCVDRNGDRLSSMSYAYPAVRKHVIDLLINSARSGCDAVSLIGHRGLPLVLFEEPVANRFFELYGEMPYELPLDEPRLNRLHCDIMTAFVRELRQALDTAFGKNKVEIHLRSQYSPTDAKNIGFDVEELAREGLITTIVSYPHRCYEIIPDELWRDEAKTRMDLTKYDEAIRNQTCKMFYAEEFDDLPPYLNSRGESCGPTSHEERIAEWQRYEELYGTKIYYEIFPRVMANEDFKKKALSLYRAGGKRIALWDTSERSCAIAMWNLVKKLGHREELDALDFTADSATQYRAIRYGEMNVNKYKPMWGG